MSKSFLPDVKRVSGNSSVRILHLFYIEIYFNSDSDSDSDLVEFDVTVTVIVLCSNCLLCGDFFFFLISH